MDAMDENQNDFCDAFFTNADGKNIFCQYWCESLKEPRALVFICHGASEHCLWYTPLALQLKKSDCYVFAHDHVGHGQSQGSRVHVEDFHEYVRDIFQHYDTVAAKFPDLPKFIIGHSMGGAISIIAGMEKPDYFRGIVLIAPAVVPDPKTVTPIKIFFGKIAARILPHTPVLYLDANYISRDPAVLYLATKIAGILPQVPLTWMDVSLISRNTAMVKRYQDDPLVYHGGLKARWGASFLKWLKWVEDNFASFKSPVLSMHGTEDKLTLCDGSRLLIEKVASKDKTLKIYEGYYHQLHSEPGEDGAEVRQHIIDWIIQRLKQ